MTAPDETRLNGRGGTRRQRVYRRWSRWRANPIRNEFGNAAAITPDSLSGFQGMTIEWPDISRRIEAGEDHRTEFKRELGDLGSIGRAICAFANAEGGVLILGVDDSGHVVGIETEPNQVRERLTQFLQTGCSAPVSARCGMERSSNGWVHWIDVPRRRGFEPLGCRGRFWIRRERSSVEPSPYELQELFNTFGFVLTEEQVIRGAGIEDIDLGAFRQFLRAQELDIWDEPQPAIEHDLLNAGAMGEDDGGLCPTLYGLMVFGKEPQGCRQTASFWLQCTAYAGGDPASEVILTGDGKGRLDEQVRRAVGWIKSLGRTESYSGLFRKDRPLVPEIALREALVNAVVHRDYAIVGSPVQLEVFDHRVDVTSPGTLPNHMKVESVQAGSRPRSRNEAMAHAMVVMGLMERRGRGWPVMRRAMREFNGTEPGLVNDEGGKFVRVTFHTSHTAS